MAGNWLSRLRSLFGRHVGEAPSPGPAAQANEPAASPKLDHPLQQLPGDLAQFPGGQSGEPLDVVIGLDFGTSSTKVAIRTPFMAGGRTLAVPFGELAHPSCTYLLPTRLWGHAEGGLFLDKRKGTRSWNDLKIRLLDTAYNSGREEVRGDDELQAVALTAGYLGLVLRQARRWFLSTQHHSCGAYRLRWQLNLGIPSAGYEDQRLRRLFLVAAQAGWDLSTLEEDPTLRAAVGAVEDFLQVSPEAQIQINVIPEVAAEVVGYARSPMRNPGLHLLVDAGASTLDICSFILWNSEGEDQYTLLTADVPRLGAFELHRRRIEALGAEALGSTTVRMPPDDPIAPIPIDLADYCPTAESATISALKAVDKEYQEHCTTAEMTTIMALRKWRDPHSSRWDEGLPVFVCGGAASMPQIQRSLAQSHDRLESATCTAGLRSMMLPVPGELDNADVDDTTFQRLAVAYGLSFDSFEIGKIVPPSEVEDIEEAATVDWRAGYVDKDMV